LKYIGFWEYEPENIYKMFELDDKLGEEYKKDLEAWQKKYGKFMGAYWLGMEPKGFGLFEFDSPETDDKHGESLLAHQEMEVRTDF
jgi:hypothetical protein